MTAQTWIDETRDLLLTDYVEEQTTLSGALTASASDNQVSLSTPGSPAVTVIPGVVAGATIEAGTELMYVYSVTDAGLAYVQRGFRGSDVAAHSSGAVVTVNPKFPAYRILNSLNDVLGELSSPEAGLFRMATVELTFNAAISGYDLTGVTSLDEIYRVTYTDPSYENTEPDLRAFDLKRNRDTDDFASGFALVLKEPGWPGQPIIVQYKTGFTALSDSSSTLASTGLHAEAYDIPPLGAAMRMVSTRPLRREFLDEQGSSRRAEEVPSGAVSASMRDLRGLYDARVSEEASRLYRRYPTRWDKGGYVTQTESTRVI